MNWSVIIPVIVAVIAPLATYIVAARRMSGKVATSDATELWAESKSIREDYRTQLMQANERALSLEMRMAKAEQRNNELERENYELRTKVMTLESLVTAQQLTITELQALLAKERG